MQSIYYTATRVGAYNQLKRRSLFCLIFSNVRIRSIFVRKVRSTFLRVPSPTSEDRVYFVRILRKTSFFSKFYVIKRNRRLCLRLA
jgi:hypothetical protein